VFRKTLPVQTCVLGVLCAIGAAVSACSSDPPAGANNAGGSGGGAGPGTTSTGGGGGLPPPAGGGGTGGAAPEPATAGAAFTHRPCERANRVGGFAVQLVAEKPEDDPPTPAFAAVTGGVRDRIDPREVWQEVQKDGACKVVNLPLLTCTPNCSGAQVCAGANRCVPAPLGQDVGAVSVTGLSSPLMPAALDKGYYAPFPAGRYPPYAAEAEVKLMAAGGAYGPFSLAGRGITPLVFKPSGLRVANDQPLALTWTAPPQPGSARIEVALDIAHHGGIGARVECDLPDTGSYTIPGALITKLISFGTAGFPTITLSRRTVDSTTIAPGCVEFAVASSVERPVEVEGVISCGEDLPCPGGRPCGADLKCR
jgi:hypothetical protein